VPCNTPANRGPVYPWLSKPEGQGGGEYMLAELAFERGLKDHPNCQGTWRLFCVVGLATGQRQEHYLFL
jgi:hypothetical protein